MHAAQLHSLANAVTAYSHDGGKAFIDLAKKYNISIISTQVFTSGSRDFSLTIKGLIATKCIGTVVFADTSDIVELLLQADIQNFDGVWLTGDVIVGDYSSTFRQIEQRHDDPLKVLRGVYAFTFGSGLGMPGNKQFVQDWYVLICNYPVFELHSPYTAYVFELSCRAINCN